jgi:hypothetical protein
LETIDAALEIISAFEDDFSFSSSLEDDAFPNTGEQYEG